MIRFPIVFACCLGFPIFAAAGTPLWLIVAASDVSPAGIAAKAKTLAPLFSQGIVFQTRDCGAGKNMFGFASFIDASISGAKRDLAITRQSIKDAYLRKCAVSSGSLLDLRIPAVDPSIAEVPANAVNWSDADRVSSSRRLKDGRSLVIIRYYLNDLHDPLEGRRERVLVAQAQTARIKLLDNCPAAAAIVSGQGRIAVQCAREQAGPYILHSVSVYEGNGQKLKEIRACRDPKWRSNSSLQCASERVTVDGQLHLTSKLTALPVAK